MATITIDTFLDDGTARTAGETWTLNSSANLTIRTDTRWHAGSPASMTGTVGPVNGANTPFGGGVRIIGTNVRWLTYASGSGNVPAIGTTITQGGVSGYLLGVWADYTSAPTAVGAAMPSTGYIKFREVTGGTYSSGALTGIGASASSADVVGWIEVIRDNTGTWGNGGTVPILYTRGAWFSLGSTNGTPGQQFQVPTNGGGTGTTITGIQIETSPGSGIYEWYPVAPTSVWTTAIVGTDARSKFCQSLGGGLVRIGTDGTSNIGFTPASGCAVRIPNIFCRHAATGTRASNQLANTNSLSRPSFTAGGIFQRYDIDLALADWNFLLDGIAGSSFTNCGIDGNLQLKFTADTISLDNVCIGQCVASTNNKLWITNTTAPITITNTKVIDCTGARALQIIYAQNVSITDSLFARVLTRSANVVMDVGNVFSSNIVLTRVSGLGSNISVIGNVSLINCDYTDCIVGNTSSSFSTTAITLSSVKDVVIDGLTFGLNGTIANVHPYNAVISSSLNTGNINIRNIGTYASPLNAGSNATFYPAFFFQETTVSSNTMSAGTVKIQRCFITNVRTAALTQTYNNYTPFVVEQLIVTGTYPSTVGNYGQDLLFKGSSMTPIWFTNGGSRLGQFFADYFRSSDISELAFLFYGIDSFSSPYVTISVANPAIAGISRSDLNLQMGDSFDITSPYWVYGHNAFTGFSINAPSGTWTLTYKIDTGSGWSSYKTLNNANVQNESISPTAGFKISLHGTPATVGSSVATIRAVQIQGVTNTTNLASNLYPLDTNTLSFTNLVAGSEVRCYTGSDPATAVEIAGVESSGTSFSFTHTSGGTVGFIRIFALGYMPFNYDPYTYAATDTSLLVQQTVDRNYTNPI